jgi:hypothetical protein
VSEAHPQKSHKIKSRVGFISYSDNATEIFEIADGEGQEEVLPDIAERPLDLAFRFGAVGAAGFRVEATMLGQASQ